MKNKFFSAFTSLARGWAGFSLAFGLSAGQAWAQTSDGVGTIELSDLYLAPLYRFDEPNRGRFDPGYSYLAASWRRDRLLSATIKVGSKNLVGVPVRYGSPVESELGLVEAYGQVDSDFGRLRLGLVPIAFGLEGGDTEPLLNFPRSLLYERRLVNLRDYGASYRIANNGFFSDWAIHNGEGGPDLDNEIWFTARWGWQGNRFIKAGFSGTAGRTSPESTTADPGNTSDSAGIDITRISRVRLINGFLEWEITPISLQIEVTGGDTRQEDANPSLYKFRSYHVDLDFEASKSFSWLARFDNLDPSTNLDGDAISEATVGFAWRSRYGSSTLFVLGSKRWLENDGNESHRAQVIWRITPLATDGTTSL